MLNNDIIKILKKNELEIRNKFHARLKGIFGSYARGDQGVKSDLDILVDFGPEADLLHFVGLCDFLESKLDCTVDLVPLGSIREEIKADILKEAIYL